VETAVAKFGLTQRRILLLLRDHHGEIGLAASMSTKLMGPGICFADETEIHANVLIQTICFRATGGDTQLRRLLLSRQ
jgi:hypothetical protein